MPLPPVIISEENNPMKKRHALFAPAVFLLSATVAVAQPGAVVPIAPCALVYGTPLTANVPLHFEARGYCGIPENATAVFLNMKAGGSTTSGKIYAWPYGEGFSFSQFNYDPIVTPGAPHSGQALVRLKSLETAAANKSAHALDISFQATTNVNFSVVVEGYVVPMP